MHQESDLSRTRLLGICGVLLSASLINYACRMPFAQNSVEIKEAFGADGYGSVEGLFGLGFACGGLLFGFLSDFVKVRWLYPVVMLSWALAGASSAWVETVAGLGISRFALGLFEAGHWPCALRTTQRVFKPAQRTWGNSLLQSGTAVGSVLTPMLILAVNRYDPAQWRLSFVLTGMLSFPWVVAWLLTLRDADLQRTVIATDEVAAGVGQEKQLREHISWWDIMGSRRWWVLVVTTISINTTWQFIRVWQSDTLREAKGYDKEFVQYFTSIYNAATLIGSIGAGWLVGRLAVGGWNVHRARVAVFAGCSMLVALLVPTAFMPAGWLYLGSWLVIGIGALGLFPVYYSFNQDLSAKYQGRVSGVLSFSSWLVQFFVHPAVGTAFKTHPEARPWLFATIGVLPLLALIGLVAFWGRREES
ncbi:MAG: MFS transporter [Planctomycetota bacterium]|nr:MAG: MFS transporter [Planctomycetota bacterium]